MLQSLGPDLWVADGGSVTGALGFHFPTRMTVVRLPGDELLVVSPVSRSEQLVAQLAEIGAVRHLLAPNTLHHTFLRDWQSAFPEAVSWGPARLQRSRPDLGIEKTWGEGEAFDGTLETIEVVNRLTDELVLLHKKSSTALFTDLLQDMPRDWYRGWRRWVAQLDLMSSGRLEVPRKFRSGFADRAATKRTVDRILAWSFDQVVVAHGPLITRRGRDEVRRAFGFLDR